MPLLRALAVTFLFFPIPLAAGPFDAEVTTEFRRFDGVELYKRTPEILEKKRKGELPPVILLLPFLNEEKTLPKILEVARTYRSVVDQIFLIDSNGTDGSTEIATQFVQQYPEYARLVSVEQFRSEFRLPGLRGKGIGLMAGAFAAAEYLQKKHGFVDLDTVVGAMDTDIRYIDGFEAGEHNLANEHEWKELRRKLETEHGLSKTEVADYLGKRFLVAGVYPLLLNPKLARSYADFERPIQGQSRGERYGHAGGRATLYGFEPTAGDSDYFSEVTAIPQPLTGEFGFRLGDGLVALNFEGYAYETARTIETFLNYGLDSMVSVDAVRRDHKNKENPELVSMILAIQANIVMQEVVQEVLDPDLYLDPKIKRKKLAQHFHSRKRTFSERFLPGVDPLVQKEEVYVIDHVIPPLLFLLLQYGPLKGSPDLPNALDWRFIASQGFFIHQPQALARFRSPKQYTGYEILEEVISTKRWDRILTTMELHTERLKILEEEFESVIPEAEKARYREVQRMLFSVRTNIKANTIRMPQGQNLIDYCLNYFHLRGKEAL